jgi:TnpA family transposase
MTIAKDYRDYMSNDFKVYVEVNADYKDDGTVIPRSFVWEDGNRYCVDNTLDVRPAASLKAGGAGLRYTVRVGGRRDVYMFLEENHGIFKWFMERKA